MQRHSSHIISSLSSLLLLFSLTLHHGTTAGTDLQQQVVVLLDSDDSPVHNVGRLLYQRHDTLSHVLLWNDTLQSLVLADWNSEVELYEVANVSDPRSLPIGLQKTYKWSNTLVQVIGREDAQGGEDMLSDFTAKDLAELVSITLTDKSDSQISIVSLTATGYSSRPAYLDLFMLQLQRFGRYQSKVIFMSTIAMLDHSGRTLTGGLQLGVNATAEIKWRHDSAESDTAWLGYFTGRAYIVARVTASATIPDIKPSSFAVLPPDSPVHVSNYVYRHVPNYHPPSYTMSDEKAFDWVDKIAQTTYKKASKNRVVSTSRQVQLLSTNASELSDLSVIEISSVQDLLKELCHYGDAGPSDTKTVVYYRFGDWVLRMNETTFYVKVVGVVMNSTTDSNDKKAKVRDVLNTWRPIPDIYPNMQPYTGSDFFDDVSRWMNGSQDEIGLELSDAYNAQCGVAMFLSESIRCFQTHITNMMSLNLAQNGYLSKEVFFASHPMARKGTWRLTDWKSGRKKTGLSMLHDKEGKSETLPNPSDQQVFDDIISRISRISKTWLSHIDSEVVRGSREQPPATWREEYTGKSQSKKLLSQFENVGTTLQLSQLEVYLRTYELYESANRLLSSNISEPECGAVNTVVQDFSYLDEDSLPLKASIALATDHAYISNLISREIHMMQQQTGKQYQVVADSIQVEDDSDIVRFFVREVDGVTSELHQITTAFDKSKLNSKALLEKILSLSNKTKPYVEWFEKGEKFTNAVVGLVSSINELEHGQFFKGIKDLGSNLKTLGDLTGITKAAEKYLGKALKGLASEAGKSVAGGVVKEVKTGVMSTIGKIEDLYKEFKPLIKGLFGIYSVFQDLQKHTVIGYIDAAFDLATTILGFFGPEAEPFELALSIIKMVVDIFYVDISRELHALPKDASVGQIVVAVLKGILDTVIDILKNIWDNINPFAAIGQADKLDKQYEKDQEFLRGLANYHNYFDLSKIKGSDGSEINFVGGDDSWNGGNITFTLGENGQSSLQMVYTDTGGHEVTRTNTIDTPGVENIILGIGEAHSFSFKTVKVHLFWLITIDSKPIISGYKGDRQTLYGTYHGNSQNNKFIAVQELPPKTVQDLKYDLPDYHYKLYGGGGNDSFYLGPQPTYAEGMDGFDAYFINSTATYTEINSQSRDGQDDTMIIYLNYTQITATRSGFDLLLTSSDTHRIVLLNWYHDSTHQRMIFKTGDGVIFKVSATITEVLELIPYAYSGTLFKKPLDLNVSVEPYSEVVAITGSDYNDTIYGNDLGNQISAGKGNDTITGGEGQDTYNVDLNKGIDTINNFAMDGLTDSLVVGAKLDQLTFTTQGEDLHISYVNESAGEEESTLAIIQNWFLNENYRHMIVVTHDQEVVKVSSTKNATSVSYQPLIINMTKLPNEHDPRVLDLNTSPRYLDVLSVYGTRGNDYIIGNGKGNYITGDKGADHFEGREGGDTYVVRDGDGEKTISNCANDTDDDTLLFEAKFDDIELDNITDSDLLLRGVANSSDIQVTLLEWFDSPQCRHITVRSIDGVTFLLPNTTDRLEKVAKSIDHSNITTGIDVKLDGKWEQVERVIGSQGNDHILGNSLDNYIDPGPGNSSYLEGGNGSDTYVIRSTYGEDNVINNYAEDDQSDTILFLVPFLMIKVELIEADIKLTSLSADGRVGIRLVNYTHQTLEHTRHLIITTIDGISFVLPVTNSTDSSSYRLVPVTINQVEATTGQHLNLTAYPATDNPSFIEVRTMYGASKYQNIIVGNAQNNTLVGGDKQDHLMGLDGDDVIKGGGGNDIIEGGRGSDMLVGGDGDDSLDGGEDNDVISPGAGENQVNGGQGVDTVLYSGNVTLKVGVTIDLTSGTCIHDGNVQDSLTSIENAYGTEYDDELIGDDGDNKLIGHGGADYFVPGSGYDLLNGGNGNDTYDLTDANGTVTILNYATDGVQDLVVMGYTNLSHVWFQVAGNDVILRAIDVNHRVFYDGSKPAIVFKSFMAGSKYRHVSMETAEGYVTDVYYFVLENSQGPIEESAPPGLYAGLALLVAVMCVLVSCVVVGVYKKLRPLRRGRTILIAKELTPRYDVDSETDILINAQQGIN